MKIIIFGDLCPTSINAHKFAEGASDDIFNDTIDLIRLSDISIVNLECPLTNYDKKSIKSGPNLKSEIKTINAIKKAGFNVIVLANNHILDYGEDGLKDTIKACVDSKIDYIGADINAQKAAKCLIKKSENETIGIMAFADNELNSANDNIAGANKLDLLYSFEQIKDVKKQCDYLIIIYHSGLEHYQYPTPQLQKRCRKMIEAGADLVTCQHSHIIGSYENYINATIVYGQGNFLFSTNNKSIEWNTGIAISVDLNQTNKKIKYIPLRTTENGEVKLAENKLASIIMEQFYKRSNKIMQDQFIENQFNQICKQKEYVYWGILMRYSRLFFIINKLANNFITKLKIKKNKTVIIQNIVQCETHNEVLLNILNRYKDKSDA